MQLKGWSLGAKGHQAKLPKWTLAPGATVRIHTGQGKSHGRDLYLGGRAMMGETELEEIFDEIEQLTYSLPGAT